MATGSPPTPPPTPAPASARLAARGEALRAWGEQHPLCQEVRAALPQRAPDGDPPGTLSVEAAPAGWSVSKGHLCVSILRVVTTAHDGQHLVAQVHATEPTDDETSPTLRLYVHDSETIVVREIRDARQWWLEALDRHYERGGDPVPTPGLRR